MRWLITGEILSDRFGTLGDVIRRQPVLLAALGAFALALAGGCTASAEPGAPPSPSGTTARATVSLPPVGADCPDLQGRTFYLENVAGLELATVELGSGDQGVVLAHQSDANMCQWLPYAAVLAGLGYRVVAFDFAGFGSSSPTEEPSYIDDIRTVVDYLREEGVARVVVVGASMGATMSLQAALAAVPPVQGVVAVSSPRSFGGISAERAAQLLQVPAYYIAGADDGDYDVYATELNEATDEAYRGLLVVDSAEHGVALVGAQSAAGGQVRAGIESFLAEHLRAPVVTVS